MMAAIVFMRDITTDETNYFWPFNDEGQATEWMRRKAAYLSELNTWPVRFYPARQGTTAICVVVPNHDVEPVDTGPGFFLEVQVLQPTDDITHNGAVRGIHR